MFYVVFASTTPPSFIDLSTGYYYKLQDLLRNKYSREGFIKEVPYTSASDPNTSLLIASFDDEAAAHHWRKDPIHLKIQKDARDNVFTSFRVRAGTGIGEEGGVAVERRGEAARETQRVVMVLEEELKSKNDAALEDPQSSRENQFMRRVLVDIKTYEHVVEEVETYNNDDSAVHLVAWDSEAAAVEFARSELAAGFKSATCIRVARNYSKVDRKEAPA